MRNDIKPEIAVVILVYNPIREKLIETLLSVLAQTDVDMEIVIADDGSEYDYSAEIDRVMKQNSFSAYFFVRSSFNQGTVLNCYSATKATKAEYVKFLSPGDLLIGERVLHDWLHSIKAADADASFSGAMYYHKGADGEICLEAWPTNPRERFVHNSGSEDDIIRHYLLYDDLTLGPAVLLRSSPFLNNLKKMLGKVKYAEDFAIRLMIADGAKTAAFDEDAILFEADSGISTSKDIKWASKIREDWHEADKLIADILPNNSLGCHIRRKMRMFATGSRLLMYICNPVRTFWRIKSKFFCNESSVDVKTIEPTLKKIEKLKNNVEI